jgi:hypothetical protein
MKVTEVFKNASIHSLRPGDELTVTRTGGRLIWNGRVAFAHDTSFPDFVVGEDYVLYLSRVPNDPESYLATYRGSFRLDKTGVHYLIDRHNVTDTLSVQVQSLSVMDFISKVKETAQ